MCMKKFKQLLNKPWKIGLIQALGVFGYSVLFFNLGFNLEKLFRPGTQPVLPMLLFFGTSLLIFALIIFAYPVMLIFDKNVKDGILIVVYTTIFLGVSVACWLAFLYGTVLFDDDKNGNSYYQELSRQESAMKAEEAKQRAEAENQKYQLNQPETVVSDPEFDNLAQVTPTDQLTPPEPQIKEVEIQMPLIINPNKIDLETGEIIEE